MQERRRKSLSYEACLLRGRPCPPLSERGVSPVALRAAAQQVQAQHGRAEQRQFFPLAQHTLPAFLHIVCRRAGRICPAHLDEEARGVVSCRKARKGEKNLASSPSKLRDEV